MTFRDIARRLALLPVILVLAGCGVRSISDSGYASDSSHGRPGVSNPFYRGELSEFDVLGIDRTKNITDEEIQRAFSSKQPLSIPKGSSIMLVQSGTMLPDDQMIKSLEKYYTVAVFTGVPEQRTLPSSTKPDQA